MGFINLLTKKAPNSERLLSFQDNNKQFSSILKQAQAAEQRFNKNEASASGQSSNLIEILMFKFGYNFLWSKGNNKLPKPLESKSTISEDKNILDNTVGINGMIHSYVHNAADNVGNPFCALDDNARYILSFDNNKPSDTNLLVWKLSKLSVEYDKAITAYHEVADLNMTLSIRYYRLNLEYDAQCAALHASKYEALNAAYYKIDADKYASLDKEHSRLSEKYLSLETVYNDKYLSLETVYNDKYLSLEAIYKKQQASLEKELIAAFEKNEEWRVANGLLLDEYNAAINDYNRLIKTNDMTIVDYNNLLEKYTSLTGLYNDAIARNKQFENFSGSMDKLWQSLKDYIEYNELLIKNNTRLKEDNIELRKENKLLHDQTQRIENENTYFKSMASPEDMVGLMYQKLVKNEISDDTMIEYVFYYLFSGV